MMTPRFVLSTFASLTLLLGVTSVRAAEKPNILLVLVDDLGWKDVGCYGNEWIETPNVDALAEQGVRFSDFYANGAVCSPTRAAIQSGQYQNRFALTAHIPGHYRPFEKLTEPPNALELPLKIPTIGQAMKAVGYSTGYFGKWHLGNRPATEPSKRGYDEGVTVGGSHFAPGFRVRPKQSNAVEDGVYQADYLTDLATDYITRNKGDKPFFLTVSYYEVHIPLQAKKEKIEKYQTKPRPPGCVTHPVYAAMVEHVDENVGRLVDHLATEGIAQNTLVVFTSDNGGLYTRYDGQGHIVTTQAPLRGEKGALYEGGIRVPTIMKWPAVAKAGSVCSAPAMSMDFYPTFLAAAGGKTPEDHTLDGVDLLPLLKEPGNGLNRRAIFWHYPHYHHSRPASAIRSGNHKLIHFYDDDSVELYDLEKDLGETINIAESTVDIRQRLRSQLDDWREKSGALEPYWNERYQPERAGEWWKKMTLEPIDLEETYEKIRSLPFDGPPVR